MTRNRIWGESKHTEEFVVINKPTRLNEIIGRLENLTAHACAACLTLGGTASLYAGYSNYENNSSTNYILGASLLANALLVEMIHYGARKNNKSSEERQ